VVVVVAVVVVVVVVVATVVVVVVVVVVVASAVVVVEVVVVVVVGTKHTHEVPKVTRVISFIIIVFPLDFIFISTENSDPHGVVII